ncbi:MAG: type I restriction endonuclease subunit R [Candidatus Promineifilaceae bacterium]|nr:type I restriction endonuclease subunit R [Candidatus Promineifilaceae bacterium]
MNCLNEETVELAALEWLGAMGYESCYGPDIGPGEAAAERESYDEVLLHGRLRRSLERINPHIPPAARAAVFDEVLRKLQRRQSANLAHNNQAVHTLLTEGVDVAYRRQGALKYDKVWPLDFARWSNNEWLAVNQFTVTDVNPNSHARTNRRPDIVLFVNGLPLAVIELKNLADEEATLEKAYNQLQTYKADSPTRLAYNEALVISDGREARLGTLTAGREWFKQWRAWEDGTLAEAGRSELEVLLKGAFAPYRFLDLLRHFTVFQADGARLAKKTAAYHQYFAVNRAVDATVEAAGPGGDRKVGVVWHTQGSGKSLSMLFYAGKVIQQPAMANPTLIVLTDRNDLDEQLFGTFAAGQDLLRQEPVQAQSREHLQRLLQVASGGVIFTTIQKFRPEGRDSEYPLLSERENIVFIADEAHRSQYGFDARLVKKEDEAYLAYGFAKYVRDALPHASFIGFTGTPIESDDISTQKVFGHYIDVYDIHRAVEDKATVPIYYEARLAKLKLREEMKPRLDPEFEAITEGEEEAARERKRSKWSALEAVVGTEERLALIAADILAHFQQRQEIMAGKGMIVAMSRRIAVDLYDQIIKLRPWWHSERDDEGAIKVIMTGSAADPEHYQPHVRNKARRKALSERFKEPDDPLRLVIVRDMWLTGFDAPPLHTMYIDKPMRGHTLMQAIARVNRVYKDKPGGLIVDYLGIAPDLKEAMARYTLRDEAGVYAAFDEEDPISPITLAVNVMITKYEVVCNFFRGRPSFDYSPFFSGSPAQRLAVIPAAMEHILAQREGKKRYMDAVTALSQAFALAMPHEQALAVRDEVAFFQAVRAAFAKYTLAGAKTQAEMEGAIKQLVSSAVSSDEVINIFDAAGLKAPDISILSDKFLAEVQGMPQQNLALELLRKLINDEIRARAGKNAVQARGFEELLSQTLQRYERRALTTTEVVVELIAIAKEMREAAKRGDELGLSAEELAFYDALAENESAVEVMGDERLAFIAHELMKMIRQNVTIDWTVKQSARAKIRVMARRILRKYGYPPDMREKATETVLQQAELIAADWVN